MLWWSFICIRNNNKTLVYNNLFQLFLTFYNWWVFLFIDWIMRLRWILQTLRIATDYIWNFSRILKTVTAALEVIYRISLILLRPAADESTKWKPEFSPLLDSCTWLRRAIYRLLHNVTPLQIKNMQSVCLQRN